MTERSYELRVSADPSLALSARVFVAGSARQLGVAEADVEDLRLLVTELLANAVDTGQPSLWLKISLDGDGWVLRAKAGELVPGLDGGPIDRRDVLHGVARVRVAEDGSLELRSLSPQA